MANNVNDNLYTIPYVTGNHTFADWVSHYNTLAINKLNLIKVYDGISGDGINLTLGTTASNDPVGGDWDGSKPADLPAGTFRVSLADSIPKGITFEEDVTISGTLNYDLGKGEVSSVKMKLHPDNGFTGTVGFTFGMPIRVGTSPENSGCSGDATYYLGKADSRDYAEVFGIVSGVTWPYDGSGYDSDNTYIEVTTGGKIQGDFVRANDDNTGLSAGTVYFLSTGNSGGFTPIEPTIAGHVSKPVLLGLTSDTGVVLHYRGQYLQGTGTGGTGGIDNNRFIVSTTSADLVRGVVVGHNGTEWRKCSSTGVVSDAVGLITKRFTLDGTDYIEIVSSGHVDNIPTDGSLGLLYVSADGELTSNAVGGVLKPFAVAWPDSGNSSTKRGVILNQNHSGSGEETSGGTSRSTSGSLSPSWAYRTDTSGATYGSAINDNLLINGAFDVWQRGVGHDGSYTATDTTYFADRWVRRNGVSGGGQDITTFSLQRMEFDKDQNEVDGHPKYYLASNHTLAGTGGHNGDFVHIENRIEDVRLINGEDVTMSFHAKCGVTGSTMGLVVNQWDGSSHTSTNMATASLGTLWSKYEVSFKVPDVTSVVTGQKHYVGVGFDVTKLNTSLDLAKVKVERGLVATVNEPVNPEEELEKCSRYYQRTYSLDETNATQTMSDNRMPSNTVIDFTTTLMKDYMYRFPVRMRGTPSVTLYSPKSGQTGDAYNRSAGVDLRKTSGTFGGGIARVAPSGSGTIRADYVDSDGVVFIVPNGAVLWDQISTHCVSDADLDENM